MTPAVRMPVDGTTLRSAAGLETVRGCHLCLYKCCVNYNN